METARLARAQAIVAQARSFIQSAAVKIEVIPRDNSQKEDEVTSKLERWLRGSQYSIQEQAGMVYRDALWHYFESGQWILRTLFDVDKAIQGMFPFCVDAIDPRQFAFQKSGQGLICAVIQEEKPAEIVRYELESYYRSASEPMWEIPSSLETAGTRPIKVTRYYDDHDEYLWVDGAPVWCKPHLMRRVPFDIAFCNDVPATQDRPEEFGIGIIFPILDTLNNEQQIMTKVTAPVELMYWPMYMVPYPQGYKVEQVYPGKTFEGAGLDSRAPQMVQPTPNYQVIEQLQGRMERDINRATLPEAAFGPMNVPLSGYAYYQALSGLQERLKDYARQPEIAYARHLSLLLWAVGRFNSNDLTTSLGLDGEQAKTYHASFAVAMSVSDETGRRRVKTRVDIDEKDVEGHGAVRVSLQPTMDKDEQSKFARAQMAKAMGMPDEYIYRDILQVEQPDAVINWKRSEELRAYNPQWQAFLMDDALQQLLALDKEMGKRFEAWKAAQEEYQRQQQMSQQVQAQSNPEVQSAIQKLGEQGVPPGPANQMLQQTSAQAAQGGVPTTPPLTMPLGLDTMPPMESFGAPPISPDEQFAQAFARGGEIPPEPRLKGY